LLDAASLQRVLNDAFPNNTSIMVAEVHDAEVSLVMTTGDQHGRPGGTVSGPTVMTLADTAAWMAILARIGPVVLAVTTSLHIDFLRKPPIGDLVADAEVLKLGRRLAVVAVRIRAAGHDELVASAQVTYSIPPSDPEGPAS
jgi:uncharacterized protein (TIGR00369 family)